LEYGLNFDQKTVITRCIELKSQVVTEDEFDTGARQMLNLGHTLGHGIEAQSNFTISHGKAVSIGMALIVKAGTAVSISSAETYNSILAILEKFGLPTKTKCSAQMLLDSALSDKKRFGATVNLIVPKQIGKCIIYETPITELLSFIEAGL
jgi:3-dehydroquinate synthase